MEKAREWSSRPLSYKLLARQAEWKKRTLGVREDGTIVSGAAKRASEREMHALSTLRDKLIAHIYSKGVSKDDQGAR